MAQEQGMRVIRQASDDAREMAMRVSNKPDKSAFIDHNNKSFISGDSRSRIESKL